MAKRSYLFAVLFLFFIISIGWGVYKMYTFEGSYIAEIMASPLLQWCLAVVGGFIGFGLTVFFYWLFKPTVDTAVSKNLGALVEVMKKR